MNETRIDIQQAFRQSTKQGTKQNISDGDSCGASEPFALRTIDDSMEPEFDAGCIIIIDPGHVARDGSFVFALDNEGEYIFRQLRIKDDRFFLQALNDLYDSIEIKWEKIEGVITQRAGKRRSYHKHYD